MSHRVVRGTGSRPHRIVGQERLRFASNEALREYYEHKYRTGGYEEGGYSVRGVDVSAMYHARRLELALRFAAPRPHEDLLDAGCGSGALAAELAPRSRMTQAVDIAANALDARFATIPNLRFRAMNVESLEFPDGRFDAVVCVETLEHLLSPLVALGEMARVLKRGGRLVLTYPTINRTFVKRCRLGRTVPVSEHLNEWSYAELVAAVESAGLRVRKVEGISFDFGVLLALKHLHRSVALGMTRAALSVRGFPRNSMFVAMLLAKP